MVIGVNSHSKNILYIIILDIVNISIFHFLPDFINIGIGHIQREPINISSFRNLIQDILLILYQYLLLENYILNLFNIFLGFSDILHFCHCRLKYNKNNKKNGITLVPVVLVRYLKDSKDVKRIFLSLSPNLLSHFVL